MEGAKLIKVALCDDSKLRLQEKKKYLEYCKTVLPIEWDIFSYEKTYSKEVLNKAMDFSVFFIHKDMKKIKGIELARSLRILNKKALIIFMAENENDVLNILDVVIFNCLVEPISKKNFYRMLEKAIKYIGKKETPFYYRYFQKDNSIEQEYILYFEKNKRKVLIHTISGVKECYMTTNGILDQIDKELFGRSHQSFIVNFYFVNKVGTSFVELINGKKIDVSRTFKNLFREKYLEYLLKKS